MIGFLSGVVRSIRSQTALVNVSGVGYLVGIPKNLNLAPGKEVELYIHTHVREDTFALFGFPDENSLLLFEELLSVSGVGPKSALAVMSSGSAEAIKKAIGSGNLSFFTSVPGIGKKSAQKIILDLKPKLSKIDADLTSLEGNSQLEQALTQLGFAKNEIIAVMPSIDLELVFPEQIKQALKQLRQ